MNLNLNRLAAITVLIGCATGSLAGEPQFQTRAAWADSPSFASAQAADEMLARCQKAGLNLILPNVMCYQTVHFKSRHFRGRVAANDQFDPLANLVEKAHALGIKVQAWCCVYYEGARDKSGQSSNPAWLNRSLAGKPFEKNFFSPSNPEVNPYLLSVLTDLLAYDIDGIHLDYIRYPGTAFDYSDAGRAAFKADAGFDPQDFLDHAERIVPPAQEKFPVRVLQPDAHAEKVWETTALERTLDQAGIGYAYVSESTARIAELRVPSLLILSSYYDVPPEMVRALAEYVGRGGNLLWTDPPNTLAKSPALQQLTGIASTRWVGARRVELEPTADLPSALNLTRAPFRTDSLSEPKPSTAQVIARLRTGEPAVLVNKAGKGRVVVLGFHMMKSTSPAVASIAKGLVGWFRAEAGATEDPLAAKRAQWVAWRGDRVTQLVRELHIAATRKNPKLVISSSGGPSPHEFYGCYRDARRWLQEGLNDEVVPMNYTPNAGVLSEMLDCQNEAAPPGKLDRIFPGLLVNDPAQSKGKNVVPQKPAVLEQQLRIVQQHGYRGFCLFAYDYLSDENIAVVRAFSR